VSETKRHTIVAGVDFSNPSDLAVLEALEQAQGRAGDLHFVAVLDDEVADPVAVRDAHLAEGAFKLRERLQKSIQERIGARFTKAPPSFETTIHVRVGRPADEIVRLARDVEADLVLVGTHGRHGVQRFLLGSVAERTLRMAHCPVLVVRPKEHPHDEQPEPACPACVEHRRETKGAEWWCKTHAQPREVPHALAYSERFHYPNPIWFGGDA
jgi:nucleotide-binding universal stress UspA family protein